MTLTIHDVQDVSTGAAIRRRITATANPGSDTTIVTDIRAALWKVLEAGHSTSTIPVLKQVTKKPIDVIWLFVYDSSDVIDKQGASIAATYVRDGLNPKLAPHIPRGGHDTEVIAVKGGTITIAQHREVQAA
jgi:hypothetical protein